MTFEKFLKNLKKLTLETYVKEFLALKLAKNDNNRLTHYTLEIYV